MRRAVEATGLFGVVEGGTPEAARTEALPRSARRGVSVVVCATRDDDDTLREVCVKAGDSPVLAVGVGRDRAWIPLAIARGAHGAVVVDSEEIDTNALVVGVEQAFAIAHRMRGRERVVSDLNNSVRELSRRIDHLSAELARLEVMAWTDSLTGLANRRQLEQRLPQVFAEAARYDRDVACVMVDLDGFKAVNDELGHAAGDELLRLAARVIVDNTRASDISARFGGDEFVVLMPETSATMAGTVAGRLIEEFAELAKDTICEIAGQCDEDALRCTMSIGVACLSSSRPRDAGELLAHADSALYAAKRSGKCAVMIKQAGGGSVGLAG